MSLPLLSTKFNIPVVGAKAISRPRLLQRLDECLQPNITLALVCGPAGYGKTTLVSQWLQTLPRVRLDQAAWLTLERGDDDLTRFLTYFVTTIQRITPGFGEGVLAILRTHKPSPVPVLATLLINELSEMPGRIFLVLDDFHLLSVKPIQSFMAFLVDHQPAQLCLFLLARTDPNLPLARLRARGQLFELRQDELCFLPEEVEEFTNRSMDLGLSPEQLAFLEQQTEGWISGLQMAAISMRGGQHRAAFFEAFSGEHKFVADYLTDEVLSGLSEPVQQFLLQTSILERLSASLCEAVTAQPAAQAMLTELVEANLFILPLDSRQVWFRYHTLFADLLRKRLQESGGSQVPELHRRASRWFEQHGLLDQAVEHAMAAEDWARAATLIEPAADSLLMQGQGATLLRWLDALPKEILLNHPALGTLKGFALITCGRPIDEAAGLYQELSVAGSLDEFQGEASTLQAMLAVLQTRSADAIQLSELALRQLPESRAFFRSLAADSLGMAYTLAGDIESATRAFQQVVDISMQSGNLMMTLMALTNLSGLRYVQGQLRAAIHTCRQVIELAAQRIGRQTPMLGKTFFNLGEMLREQGDLEAAHGYLTEAAGMLENFTEIGAPLAWLALARLELYHKDWPAAQADIDKARHWADASRSTLMDDRLVDVMQARYWLTRGELQPVIRWARQCGFLDRSPAEIFEQAARSTALHELFQAEYLMLVRLTLAQHQPERALEMLTPVQELVEGRGLQRKIIEVLCLKALALHQSGQVDQALHTIHRALDLGEPEGYQRIFVDEGEPMARLLYQAAAHNIAPDYVRLLLGVLAKDSREVRPAQKGQANSLIEPLSRRELQVLQLIAEGLSNGEIAVRLVISLSTVKGHTTTIYGKLGVKNRTQAIAQARALGLLSLA